MCRVCPVFFSVDEPEGAIVPGRPLLIARQTGLAEEAEGGVVVATGIEHDEGRLPQNWVQVVEQGVGAQQRVDAADTGDQNEILLRRLDDFAEAPGELFFVQHALGDDSLVV